ncbi:carbohydrate kinase family protein [Thermodesulfobacteriota bacterium]
MASKLDVIGLGTNAIDQVIRLYRIPDADAKVVCPPRNYELFDGGVMGNTLTGLSRLGLKTGYLGKIGDDGFGQIIRKSCTDDGIDLSRCEVVPGKHSAWTWIVVDDKGERTIVLFPNILTEVDEEFITDSSEYIKSGRLLHLEGSEMRLKPFIEGTKIAKSAGRLITFDLDIPASDFIEDLALATMDELEEMISLCDLFIPCIGGAKDLTNKEEPLDMAVTLLEKYKIPRVAISHGAEGCFVATEKEAFQSPAYRIDPVDGTGSGDAFHAGMIFGFLKGWDMKDTAKFANACGALNTIKLGARSGMCSEEEVRHFMENNSLC